MQLRKFDSCQGFVFESALSDPRNASTPHQTFNSPTAPHLPIIAQEMKLLESEIESLDLGFLDHIALADGIFVIQETHKTLIYDVDSDSDDSTADLTDDSVSMDESSDRSPSNLVFLQTNEFLIPTCIMEESPSLIKPRRCPPLISYVSEATCPSSEAIYSQKSKHEKLQIKTVAQESEIRKQPIRNESMKRQLQQSHKHKTVLQIKLPRPEDESLVNVIQTEDFHAEQQNLTEMEAIRAQLDANETRIQKLRNQRNEDAALCLNLELMIARLGTVSPESEHVVLSVAKLKCERDYLRNRLRSAGIDDAIVEASVQQRVKEREFESTRIMQELSLRVQELQNDKNELSEQIRSHRTAIGNLRASGLELDAHIEMLESVYCLLTKSELEACENGSGLPVVSSVLTGRFSKIHKIFRRR